MNIYTRQTFNAMPHFSPVDRHCFSEMLLLALLILQMFDAVSSHWWLSSQVFSVASSTGCNNIAGLVKEQKVLCQRYPSLMEPVGKGAETALKECQHQFATSKWNCSHVDNKQNGLLGLLTSKGNKEAAFLQAITSAGIVAEITDACNRDEHYEACSCVYSNERSKDFQWSGCNDNIKFGLSFAQRFMDAKEVGNDARVLMNKQNNLAGRMAVLRHMHLDCVCHGMSGTCSMKTCRHSLPPFYRVGDYLNEKYGGAIPTTIDQNQNKLIPLISGVKGYTQSDLVYLEESPDYCVKDEAEGTLGVADRLCNKTSLGPDGCGVMCCGMGWNAKHVVVEDVCRCEFIWCCQIKCERCKRKVKQHYCRAKKRRKEVVERRFNQIDDKGDHIGPSFWRNS